MNEFDKELNINFKAETDATFDPFKETLEATLKEYEKKLENEEYKTESEKAVLKNMVTQIMSQIEELERIKLEDKT